MVDAVVFVATLEFVPRIDAIIDEATRVLRPDGTGVALILNTRSAYVQSNPGRRTFSRIPVGVRSVESPARGVVLPADGPSRLRFTGTTTLADLDGTQEYLLGIDGETVIERSDPDTAAVTAVVGPHAGVTMTLALAFNGVVDD